MATEVIVTPWHPVNNPECTNCRGLARPVRPKKKSHDCGLVTIKLSRSAQDRRLLLKLIYDAELPQAEFAEYILGVDDATVYRYLRGAGIPNTKAAQLRSIQHISREGRHVHVIFKTPDRPRWADMIRKRRRSVRQSPLHMQDIEQGEIQS